MAEVILQDTVKQFGDFTAVDRLNLTVQNKEFLVLLGPSGCGKTTTLRMISGLELPTSGKILLNGEDVTNKRASQRDIAFVFQLYALYPHMSTYKNIAFPLKAQGFSKEQINQEVDRISSMLRIKHILKRKPKQLSGGDLQRVALGRALVRRPQAFLLDEPIGTLDAAFREEMRTELKKLHVDVGATSVYVTHDQVEAMSMGDRIAVMRDGVLQQVDEPHTIYADPNNLFVAQFIGSPGMSFLDCRPETHNGETSLRLVEGNHTIHIPKELQQLVNSKTQRDHDLVLGVRPEDVMISRKAEDNHIPVEVYVTEKMGSFRIVDVQYGERALRVRTSPHLVMEQGERAHISFDMRRIRLFDKQTEESIMKRDT